MKEKKDNWILIVKKPKTDLTWRVSFVEDWKIEGSDAGREQLRTDLENIKARGVKLLVPMISKKQKGIGMETINETTSSSYAYGARSALILLGYLVNVEE